MEPREWVVRGELVRPETRSEAGAVHALAALAWWLLLLGFGLALLAGSAWFLWAALTTPAP